MTYNNFWNDLKSGRFASMVNESVKGQSISSPEEVYNVLKPLYQEEPDIEKVFFIFLDSKNKIIAIENLFKGTLTGSVVYNREIIKKVLSHRAAAVIMSHNHPSGEVSPSPEDQDMTLKVGVVLSGIDVSFHDHIIVGNGYHSMSESGIIAKSRQVYDDIMKGKMCCEPTTERINIEIMENELSATDWELNSLAWELYWFVDLFQIAFFKDKPVPIPALTFEKSRVNNLGSYRLGLNDWAVREQINLNRLHLSRPLWQVLSTLFHELIHSFEYQYIPENKRTKSWYHSKAFKEKMEEFGIYCADNGSHIGIDPKGRFVMLLTQHAVSFDEIPGFNKPLADSRIVPIDPKPKVKGKSKLRKWSCGCQNVRVGTQRFEATCDICDRKFELAE